MPLKRRVEDFSQPSWCAVLTLSTGRCGQTDAQRHRLLVSLGVPNLRVLLSYSLGLSKHGKSSWETLASTRLSHLNCESKIHFQSLQQHILLYLQSRDQSPNQRHVCCLWHHYDTGMHSSLGCEDCGVPVCAPAFCCSALVSVGS